MGASPDAPEPDPALRTHALVERAASAGLALFAIEQAVFWSGYGRRLVHGAGDHLAFVAGCLAYALLSTLIVVLVGLGVGWLHGRLSRTGRGRDPRLGQRLCTAVALALGAAVAVSQDGHPGRPDSLALAPVWLLPAVLIYLAWRRQRGDGGGAARNAAALLAVVGGGLYLADYELLWLFRSAAFGLDERKELLRALIAPGVVTCWLGLASLGGRLVRPAPREGAGLRAAQWGCVAGLQWVDQRLFVDLHLPVHAALWCAQWIWAFRLTTPAGLLRGRHAPAGAALAVVTAAAFVAWLPSHAGTRYLLAQHTGASRQALELLHGYVLHPQQRLAFVGGLVRRSLRAGDGPLPADGRPLPDTFARPRDSGAGPHFATPPNVVVFMLDMKRPRDIGPHDDTPSRTPHIDRCFAGGQRLPRARSSSTRTLAVFPSIYSGTYAGSRGMGRPDLAARTAWELAAENGDHNLVSALRAGGYETRLLTNRYYLRFFEGQAARPAFGEVDLIVAADEDAGLNTGMARALRAHPELLATRRPFALLVHFMSHPLRELPEVDAVIGQLCDGLAERGVLADTVRMLTADHGVQFGEHGRQTYGRTLYDEELRVPLRWYVPGLAARTVDGAVSAVDHLATLVDLLDLPAPFPTEGRTYLPLLAGRPPEDPGRPIYFEVRRHTTPATGVLRGADKLLHFPRTDTWALFDVGEDPEELRNLADAPAAAGRFDTLRALVEDFRRARGER